MPDEHQERSQTQKPARKKLIRRDDRDHSQPLRVTVQILFAILNVWIGVQFYLWVRWAESGGRAFEVSRPAGVEGWLPIEGLMQLKCFLITGKVPHVHAAGFFLFTSFLVISFVFRKAFCSWMCPVGTVSEYLWKLGHSISGRSFQLPRWADIPLRSLKYLVLSFFAYAVIGMSAASIAEFLNSPYALIVDVRMLNFFRYISGTAAWVVLGLVIASIASIVLSQGDFSQTNNCPLAPTGTIPPSNAAYDKYPITCTFTVYFTPSQKGTRNATITINDNGYSKQQVIKLTGIGD